MVSSEHIQYTIPEDPDNPYRLGWKVNHDPRSADYPYQPRTLAATQVVSRPAWPSILDILDQGQLGSCVPNTGVEWLATANELQPPLSAIGIPGIGAVDLTDPVASEWAIADPDDGLYHLVTNRDPFRGAWTPDDTGSDGTSLGNLFIDMGWAESFEHAFAGLSDVLSGLMETSVWMGSDWYSSMFTVDSEGFLVITPGAYVAGGHQYLLDGEVNVEEQWCGVRNHWQKSWAMNGRAKMRWSMIERLLGQNGDAQIVRPKIVAGPPPFPESPENKGCLGQFKLGSIARHARRIWTP